MSDITSWLKTVSMSCHSWLFDQDSWRVWVCQPESLEWQSDNHSKTISQVERTDVGVKSQQMLCYVGQVRRNQRRRSPSSSAPPLSLLRIRRFEKMVYNQLTPWAYCEVPGDIESGLVKRGEKSLKPCLLDNLLLDIEN